MHRIMYVRKQCSKGFFQMI